MKKLVIVILILLSAVSCRIVSMYDIDNFDENPFLVPIDLAKISHQVEELGSDGSLVVVPEERDIDVPDIIKIPIITDVHADRTGNGVHIFEDAFKKFLKDGEYPFVIDLGDLLDDGQYEGSEAIRFYREIANLAQGNHIICIGNHELHGETTEAFDKVYGAFSHGRETVRMGKYVFGRLSIYKVDNSLGIFGRKQLDWIEEALAADKNPYKIVIAHENMATSRTSDQSVVITGMTDQREVHHMMKLMYDNDVQLMLTGHHHKGNIVYRFNDKSTEVNLAAFHRKESAIDFESDGFFYLLSIDTNTGDIKITSYSSETGDEVGVLYD